MGGAERLYRFFFGTAAPAVPEKPPTFIARIQFKDGSYETWTGPNQDDIQKIVDDILAGMGEPFAKYRYGFVRTELVKHVSWHQRSDA